MNQSQCFPARARAAHGAMLSSTEMNTGLTNSMQFSEAFQALTGYKPMKWQYRMFWRMMDSKLPLACDLPTGLGKTSVIPIWLTALASQVDKELITLPRRLIYIVNRRTVVDQATRVVEEIRRRLHEPNNPAWKTHTEALRQLVDALRKLSAGLDDLPLAISTLRGELADNEEWKADPARAVIIVGTIDMIGSKLLFSGYGDGRYHRTHHAGLIGQDSLIVHDEAHLTPAFSELLRNIAAAQDQSKEKYPVRVMELSATTRKSSNDVLTLEPEDEKDGIVQQRLDAEKHLRVHKAGQDELAARLVELALKHEASPCRVLIYVQSPESAQSVAVALGKELDDGSAPRISLLTGTIRGHERDQLVQEDPVYRSLLNREESVERTIYLVSTSAGEVGVDFDADHMVCDLTTLDSMIQRLGRVNRRGGKNRTARIDVVAEQTGETSELGEAFKLTQAILVRLHSKADGVHNASPRSLRELLQRVDDSERSKAFSPKPETPPLTDILLDAWSLTSITKPMPGRPEVAPYLHGLADKGPPETYVAWRKEVKVLDEAGVDSETLRDWFRACRIEARERLRDRSDRVRSTLEKLLEKHRKQDEGCDFPVVVLDERGEAKRSWLSKIIEKDFGLAYRTVVLPVEAGGLNAHHGTLDGGVVDHASDVAEPADEADQDRRRERWVVTEIDGAERWERFTTGETAPFTPANLRELERVTLNAVPEGADDDVEARYLVLLVSLRQSALEDPEITRTAQTLAQHTSYIEGHAASVAKALKLDSELAKALVTAARWHDQGKDRPVWQRFACNPNPSVPLAKSMRYLHGRALSGYRHEFGSLLEAQTDAALIKEYASKSELLDLILHLIAAHHGWARPHFEANAWDPPPRTTRDNEQAAAEVMRRFGRLQQRFGRWGLAWLESLLRCADITASKESAAAPSPSVPEEMGA